MSKKDSRVTLQIRNPTYRNSLSEFLHEISVQCGEGDWVFRGQGADGWPTPRIARGLLAKTNPAKVERALLDEFLQKIPSIYSREISTDWEALAIMQHYGGMTRLLDWTRNPLVAAWFALNTYLSVPKKERSSSGPVVWAVLVRSDEW
ncbi:MAG: FRG domain-containing protein, partial [Dokdonella sp.]